MQKIKLFLLLALLPVTLFAQIEVKGKIIDKNDSPVQLAEVIMLNLDNKAVSTTLTNEEGFFKIKLISGHYSLKVKQLNNTLVEKKFLFTSSTNLEVLKVEDSKQLEEVVITAKKKLIERKVDRLVFNVENNIATQGMSSIDLLQNTPLLKVDERTGISIVGKSGVGVMINNRILHLSGTELMNYLQNLKSDNIAKIEIITTPPAKYDAQGNSGLINIILKKNPNNGWSGKIGSSVQKNSEVGGFNNLMVNYQSNALGFSVNGYKNTNGFAPKGTTDVITNDNNNIATIENRIDQLGANGFDINASYKINDRSELATMFEMYNSYYNMDTENKSKYDFSNTIPYTLYTNSSQNWKTPSLTMDLFYDVKLDTLGAKMSISTNLSRSKSDRKNNFFTSSNEIIVPENNVLTNSKINYNIYSGQIDFTLPYKWSTMETGLKYNYLSNISALDYNNFTGQTYTIDPAKSNAFDYIENNYAVYVSFEKQINQKWSSKAGLRYEYTTTKGASANGNDLGRKYSYFFPTIYVSFSPNEKNSFSTTFSSRINRPSLQDLNPSRWYSNPYMYYEGSIDLQPSVSYNTELAYTYNNALTFTLYNQYSTDEITDLTDVDGNIYKSTKKNVYNQNSTGLTVSYYTTFFKNWEFSTNASGFYTVAKPVTDQLLGMKQYSMTYSINNSINLNKTKTISYSLNFFHNLPNIYGTTYLKDMYGLSSGIRFAFLEKSLKISLSVSDIFKTIKSDGYTNYNDFIVRISQYNDYRKVALNCSYSFGNKKVKKISTAKEFEENNRKN